MPFSNRGRVGELCSEGGRCHWRNVSFGLLTKARFRKCSKCGDWQFVASTGQRNLPNFNENLKLDIEHL